MRRAVDAVMAEFGRIDVLVTSATNIDFSPDGTYLNEFVATSWEALERHIQVNITSSMLLLRLVLPVMYAQGSGIVMSVTQASAWLEFPDLPMPGQGICGMAIPVTRGVTDGSHQTRARGRTARVTILTFDPGMTISNASERYADTLKRGIRPRPRTRCSCLRAPRPTSRRVAIRPCTTARGSVRSISCASAVAHRSEIFPDWREGVQEVTSIPPLVAADSPPIRSDHAVRSMALEIIEGKPSSSHQTLRCAGRAGRGHERSRRRSEWGNARCWRTEPITGSSTVTRSPRAAR